jgi:hypothetical protein
VLTISRKADNRQICRSCEGDKPSEIRGSGFQYAKFTRQRKPRNPDTRFCELIAAVKSNRDLDRSFVWKCGSQEASSEFRGSGFQRAKKTMQRKS